MDKEPNQPDETNALSQAAVLHFLFVQAIRNLHINELALMRRILHNMLDETDTVFASKTGSDMTNPKDYVTQAQLAGALGFMFLSGFRADELELISAAPIDQEQVTNILRNMANTMNIVRENSKKE
jgi:hypothetical protein